MNDGIERSRSSKVTKMFNHKPKESASAQGIWERGNKISASTQPAWKVDEIAALVTKALQNK